MDLEALKTFIPYILKPLEFGDVKPFESYGQHGKISSIPRKNTCPTERICLTTLDTHSGHTPWGSVLLETTLSDFRGGTEKFRRYFGLVPRTQKLLEYSAVS